MESLLGGKRDVTIEKNLIAQNWKHWILDIKLQYPQVR